MLACAKKLQTVEESSDEFLEWWEEHKMLCDANFKGSSPAMEAAAALDMWKRSERHLHLRYTNVISDGDSKTVSKLQESKPYGEGVDITKYECVGHIQKRMGKGLREAKKAVLASNRQLRAEVNKLKEKLGVQGKGKGKGGKGRGKGKEKGGGAESEKEVGKLCERMAECETKIIRAVIRNETIDLLQTYYGNAIRSHSNDLKGMTAACWAVYYHSVSYDEDPQHYYCPGGATSWCKYQQALANNEDPPPHTTRIDYDWQPYVLPVFERLCDATLLEKCLMGATQNRNESFNKLIWARAPKTEFCSLATVQIAVSHATLVFNSGCEALRPVLEGIGVDPGPFCSATLAARDRDRSRRAVAKAGEVAKKKRAAQRRREKRTEEAHIEEEGVTYEAGAF